MENQNNQWEKWGEQPQQQPQTSWGEQPQQQPQTSGDEQPQQQPQTSWGEQPQQQPPLEMSEGEQPQQEASWGNFEPSTPPPTSDIGAIPISKQKSYSFLGGIDLLKIKNELYYLSFNKSQVLEELNSQELNPIGNDGLYQTKFNPNTQLGNIISSIGSLAESKGLELTSVLVKKLKPSESSLNITKGNPKNNFILFIQGDYNSGEVILDLSSIGGPSSKILDTTPNHLTLLPGWLPYRITKNNSDKELIALVGTFS